MNLPGGNDGNPPGRTELTSIRLRALADDVLSGFDEIKVCTHYQIDGKNVYTIPASNIQFKKCVPVYEVLKGWKEDISNVKSFDELPENAKKYIEFIEKETGLPVSIFSVGPDKYQTIIRKEIF